MSADWEKVEEAFARHDRYRVLADALVAMRKLADMLQRESGFTDVEPRVSHVSLRLRREGTMRDVWVSWHEGKQYAVYFGDHALTFSDQRLVIEDDVVRVLREYLDQLDQKH